MMGLYKVCKKHDAGEFWIEYGCTYHRIPMSLAVTYTQVSTACGSTYLLHSLTSGKLLSAGRLMCWDLATGHVHRGRLYMRQPDVAGKKKKIPSPNRIRWQMST